MRFFVLFQDSAAMSLANSGFFLAVGLHRLVHDDLNVLPVFRPDVGVDATRGWWQLGCLLLLLGVIDCV